MQNAYERYRSMLWMLCSLFKNHLSMFVICHILSTVYPRWNAAAMANILLSVGLVSSLSMSSTKSFFADGSVGIQCNRQGVCLPWRIQ